MQHFATGHLFGSHVLVSLFWHPYQVIPMQVSEAIPRAQDDVGRACAPKRALAPRLCPARRRERRWLAADSLDCLCGPHTPACPAELTSMSALSPERPLRNCSRGIARSSDQHDPFPHVPVSGLCSLSDYSADELSLSGSVDPACVQVCASGVPGGLKHFWSWCGCLGMAEVPQA